MKKDWRDNTYEYTGSASGYTRKGEKFNFEIIKPLVSVASYRYFVSGVTYTETERFKRSVDYGDGEQDNIAVETINDKVRKIELKW
jgi:hypothetical protein